MCTKPTKQKPFLGGLTPERSSMLNRTFPQWKITSAKPEDIRIVTEWMSEIGVSRIIDKPGLYASLKHEFSKAEASRYGDYLMGYHDERAIFFMIGHLAKSKPFLSSVLNGKANRRAMKIELLFNPTILANKQFYLTSWHQAIKYSFEKPSVSRITVDLEMTNHIEKEALTRLGFHAVSDRSGLSITEVRLSCRRSNFFSIAKF